MLTGFEVMKADPDHAQIMVDNQVVLMREDDCTINATQNLKLFKKPQGQQKRVLKSPREKHKAVIRRARGTHGPVSIQCEKELCVKPGLAEKLQPLLDYGLALQLNKSYTCLRSVVHLRP